MKQITVIFIITLIMIKVLSAQDYERFVSNSIYLVQSLDIATELLIKEHDIFYVRANTVELTGALCEVLGRLIMLNETFSYGMFFQSMKKDPKFWLYMKERALYFIDRLSQAEPDDVIRLITVQLELWTQALAIDFGNRFVND